MGREFGTTILETTRYLSLKVLSGKLMVVMAGCWYYRMKDMLKNTEENHFRYLLV